MGQFEETTKQRATLPDDLPSAKESAAQHPDGAVYKANNGKRYRLRHPRWIEVSARKRTANGAAKKK